MESGANSTTQRYNAHTATNTKWRCPLRVNIEDCGEKRSVFIVPRWEATIEDEVE